MRFVAGTQFASRGLSKRILMAKKLQLFPHGSENKTPLQALEFETKLNSSKGRVFVAEHGRFAALCWVFRFGRAAGIHGSPRSRRIDHAPSSPRAHIDLNSHAL
jgi:hypothetical protein